MSPSDVPHQRSPQETLLPARPEGFAGHCEWHSPIDEKIAPKGSPRKVQYLGSAEWADSPAHCRIDGYYLNPRGHHWLLWIRYRDDNSYGWPWRWTLYGWGPRKGVSWEQAAAYLLMDAWAEESQHGQGRFAWISDAGELSAVGMNAIADRVWPLA